MISQFHLTRQMYGLIKEYEKSRDAYELGFDCGMNGPNTTNCHFAIFSSQENLKKWEQGKRDGDAKRKGQA